MQQKLNLTPYRINVNSQNGEDLVIEKIFEIAGIKDGWLIEFGAWDGIYLSNTRYHAVKNTDFYILLIESDDDRYQNLLDNQKYFNNKSSCFLRKLVQIEGDNSINNILNECTKRGHNFDNIALMSIDVDGTDLDIWNSLDKSRFSPKVVIIEEGGWANPERLGHLVNCFEGYTLVCVTGNFIFVRNDLGIESKQTIHELIETSGSPEYDLKIGKITKADADWFFDRLVSGENDLYTKLAGEQNIYFK